MLDLTQFKEEASLNNYKCVIWDNENELETQEAEIKIENLLDQGYEIEKERPGEVLLKNPEIDKNFFKFQILSQNGDDVLVWDRRDPEQVKDAKNKFKDYLSKGYTAYSIRGGQRGAKLTTFDELREHIILGEDNALMVPKSIPG